MMKPETVVGLYPNLETANQAVRELVAAGFPRGDISLVANDTTGAYSRYLDEDDVQGGDGAAFGALMGGLTGVVVGLSTIVVPGVGPIVAAGPLAALIGGTTGAAVGAVAGAVTGGLTASFINLGVPQEFAEYYAEALRRGGSLVTVAAQGEDIADAVNILHRHHPIEVERRDEDWHHQSWQSIAPHQQDQLEK